MDSLTCSNGEIIPAGSLMDLAYQWFLKWKVPVHGLKYQIVQQKDKTVSVYLVSDCYDLNGVDISRIKHSFVNFLPENMPVEIIYNKRIPFNDSKKYRPVISLVEK